MPLQHKLWRQFLFSARLHCGDFNAIISLGDINAKDIFTTVCKILLICVPLLFYLLFDIYRAYDLEDTYQRPCPDAYCVDNICYDNCGFHPYQRALFDLHPYVRIGCIYRRSGWPAYERLVFMLWLVYGNTLFDMRFICIQKQEGIKCKSITSPFTSPTLKQCGIFI